ncbi:hypothetical protein ACOME3_008614 [Neoechinorhynchus agilis]
MNPYSPKEADDYACFPFKIDNDANYFLTRFQPKLTSQGVHHMLLFGCSVPVNKHRAWNCKSSTNMHSPCLEKTNILYAWTMNASDVVLPKDVSFRAGSGTDIQYLVLQIHYKDPFESLDASGVDVTVSKKPTSKRAGMILLAASDGLIDGESIERFEIASRIDENVVLHPFAYRVHAHSLGLVNSLFHVTNDDKGRQFWTEIGRRSPQLPQNFVNANPGIVIKYGDWLTGICTMINTNANAVRIGATRSDEMCNIYLLYWVWGNELLENSIILADGPPIEYFENHEELDLDAIPPSAYLPPPSPNGYDSPVVDEEIKRNIRASVNSNII